MKMTSTLYIIVNDEPIAIGTINLEATDLALLSSRDLLRKIQAADEQAS
jgi:hypothetical protein